MPIAVLDGKGNILFEEKMYAETGIFVEIKLGSLVQAVLGDIKKTYAAFYIRLYPGGLREQADLQ